VADEGHDVAPAPRSRPARRRERRGYTPRVTSVDSPTEAAPAHRVAGRAAVAGVLVGAAGAALAGLILLAPARGPSGLGFARSYAMAGALVAAVAGGLAAALLALAEGVVARARPGVRALAYPVVGLLLAVLAPLAYAWTTTALAEGSRAAWDEVGRAVASMAGRPRPWIALACGLPAGLGLLGVGRWARLSGLLQAAAALAGGVLSYGLVFGIAGLSDARLRFLAVWLAVAGVVLLGLWAAGWAEARWTADGPGRTRGSVAAPDDPAGGG